jgi:hypothetical protein
VTRAKENAPSQGRLPRPALPVAVVDRSDFNRGSLPLREPATSAEVKDR